GDRLGEGEREAENGLPISQKGQLRLVMYHNTAQLCFIRPVRGSTANFGSFNAEGFDELRFERHLADNPALAEVACWYSVRKLQARFFVGGYAGAREASGRGKR